MPINIKRSELVTGSIHTAADGASSIDYGKRITTSNTTAALPDSSGVIVASSSAVITVTIPGDNTVDWPDFSQLIIYQSGTGIPVFAAGSGVTLRSPTGVAASVQYGFTSAVRVGSNEWALA